MHVVCMSVLAWICDKEIELANSNTESEPSYCIFVHVEYCMVGNLQGRNLCFESHLRNFLHEIYAWPELNGVAARGRCASKGEELGSPLQPCVVNFLRDKVVPLNLTLPQTLKKNLHLSYHRRKPSQRLEMMTRLVTLSVEDKLDCQAKLILGNIPLQTQRLGVFICLRDFTWISDVFGDALENEGVSGIPFLK